MTGAILQKVKEKVKNSSSRLLFFNSILLIGIVAALGIVSVEKWMNYEENGLLAILVLLIYLIVMLALGNMYPEKLNLFSAMILLPLNLLFFPYMLIFAEGGGIKSGMPVWLTFGIVLTFLVLDGKPFWWMFTFTITIDVFMIFYVYRHENLIQTVEDTLYYYEDNLIAILAVACSTGLIIKYQSVLEEKQKEKIRNTVVIAEQEKKNALLASQAKSNFLTTMSHDIRTPMNAIAGMTELAKYHIDDKEKVKEYLDKMQVSLEQLLYVINNVLDMSEIETNELHLKPERFNMEKLIENLEAVFTQMAVRKQITFQVQMERTGQINLIGDAVRLRQVFMNILGNSFKYTESGGTVRFSVEQIENNLDDFVMYTFTIEDTGIGMSQDFIDNILFSPYQRGKNQLVKKSEGSGIGMNVTKNILQAMGATLSVTSEIGKGSCFVIQMRIPIDKTEHLPESEEENQIVEAAGKNILIVEDNEINMEMIRNIMERTHANVISVYDGESAIEAVQMERDGYFDLIFMDIQLPGIDGYQATRAIRCLPKEDALTIPIIAMTANVFSEDVEKARDNGMDAHIAKPIDVKEVYEKMYDYLYHR